MFLLLFWLATGLGDTPDWAFGRSLLNEGKWAEASQFYESILAKNPQELHATMMLGIIDLNLGHYPAAIDAFQAAIDGQFLVFVNRLNLAKAQALAGQKKAALATLETWVQAGIGDFSKLESDPSLANLQSEPEWSGLLDLAQRTATPCAFNPQKQVFSAFQGNWQVFDGFGNLFAHSSFSPALGSCVWVETFSAHYAKTEWTIYWSADDQGKVFQAWFTDKGRQGRMVGESDQPWRFMETRANAKGEDQCNCMEVSTNPDDSLLMISFLGEGPCSSKSTFKETGRMIYRRDPSGSQEKTK